MIILDYLSIILFTIWCLSEIVISMLSHRNQSKSVSTANGFSSLVVWLLTIPPIWFAILIHAGRIFTNGFGNLSALFPLLGYLGCLALFFGISIRLLAVATLNKQFTLNVSVVEKHEIVDVGIYKIIRHPAYLGLLASLFGMGLLSENWVSLVTLVVFPLVGLLYRIKVEESALLHHFGGSYQEYARRTKRMFPGIW